MARAPPALLLAAAVLCSAAAHGAAVRVAPQEADPQHMHASPAPRDLPALIDRCIERLDTTLDVGFARIAARCPDLEPALARSPWAAWLPGDWRRPDNSLSAGGLEELRTLIARESGRNGARRPIPRTVRVSAALAAIARSDEATGSWWRQFKDWLRRILAPHPRAQSDWLRWLMGELNLSAQTTEAIGWAALTLTVAFAVAIVIGELRTAGLLGLRPRRRRTTLPKAAARSVLSLEAIGRAVPEEQPALLLDLIASTLVEQGRLPPAWALTAREVGRRAQLPEESGRGQLTELVAVCERVRFSREIVGTAILSSALHSGRRLLAMLEPSAAMPLEAH